MKPTKHVGAVVDSIEPAAWIVQLLQNLAHHPLLQAQIWQRSIPELSLRC